MFSETDHRLIHKLLTIDFRCKYIKLCLSRTYVYIYLMECVMKFWSKMKLFNNDFSKQDRKLRRFHSNEYVSAAL